MRLEESLGKLGGWLDKRAEEARVLADRVVDEVSARATRLQNYFETETELSGLTADDIIERVNAYQNSEIVHPLTCAVKSSHKKLKPVKAAPDDQVVLVCPTCNHVQTHIPTAVLLAYPMIKEAEQAMADE